MLDLGLTVVDALRMALLLALPVLGVAGLVGVGVGLVQAATRLAEPSLNAMARLLSGGVVLAVCGPFMGTKLTHYTTALWSTLEGLPR